VRCRGSACATRAAAARWKNLGAAPHKPHVHAEQDKPTHTPLDSTLSGCKLYKTTSRQRRRQHQQGREQQHQRHGYTLAADTTCHAVPRLRQKQKVQTISRCLLPVLTSRAIKAVPYKLYQPIGCTLTYLTVRWHPHACCSNTHRYPCNQGKCPSGCPTRPVLATNRCQQPPCHDPTLLSCLKGALRVQTARLSTIGGHNGCDSDAFTAWAVMQAYIGRAACQPHLNPCNKGKCPSSCPTIGQCWYNSNHYASTQSPLYFEMRCACTQHACQQLVDTRAVRVMVQSLHRQAYRGCV
jgi:hypothetical protein